MRYPTLRSWVIYGVSWAAIAVAPLQADRAGASSLAETEFWARSQALIEEQLQVLSLLESATLPSPQSQLNGQILATTQSERQNLARDRLGLHLLKLERYLRDRSIMPEFLCRDGSRRPPDFSAAQQQVYCSLFYSQQQLQPFIPFLDRRRPLTRSLPFSALPAPPAADENDIPTANLEDDPNGSPFSAAILALESGAPEPIVVTQPAKALVANGNNALTTVLIPNAAAIQALETSRRLLLTAQSAFPGAPQPTFPLGRTNYAALYPEEAQRYANVLARPNTGMTTIYAEPPSPLDLNQLRDRLSPELGATHSLIPLETLTYGFLPRLALRVEGDVIAIAANTLTYGFMVDLGEGIDFADFPDSDDGKIDWHDRDFRALNDAQRELFVNYRPPRELRAIEADQRRFFFGKLGFDLLPNARPPAVAYAPAQLNRTYLLRLIEYQLPEPVLSGEPIARSRRRHAGRILETPSSDLAIAFRPVRRNPDGSYVILWKVVKAFEKPEIKDLDRYVDFQ